MSQFPVIAVNTSFSHNEAGRLGGGLHLNLLASFKCDDCRFWDNSAAVGGAVSASGAEGDGIVVTIRRSKFLSNSALSGGAMDVLGSLNCTDVTFEGNKAGKGGALSLGSEMDVTPLSKLEGCQFLGNDAASEGGGAVIKSQADVLFSRCKWEGNAARSTGAGLALGQHKGALTIVNSIFTANKVASGGGGALSVAQHADPAITVVNSTFKSNQVRCTAYSDLCCTT